MCGFCAFSLLVTETSRKKELAFPGINAFSERDEYNQPVTLHSYLFKARRVLRSRAACISATRNVQQASSRQILPVSSAAVFFFAVHEKGKLLLRSLTNPFAVARVYTLSPSLILRCRLCVQEEVSMDAKFPVRNC
jgi:hypothetical protein